MTASAADHYDVRWRPQGTLAWSNPVKVSPIDEIVIEGLDRSVTYEIEVRAVSACGAVSEWVPSDYVVPGQGTPPAVDALTAASLADGVHLAWSVDTAPPAGVEYSVERSATDTGGWAERTRVRSLTYTDIETSGTLYYYRVRMVTFAGAYGAYSPIVSSAGVSIDALQTEVDNAAADALAANQELANIASDNVLSQGEKPVVIRDYNVITTEQAGIDAQATAYSITTQKTAYDSAVTALTSYLGTLTSPTAWNNLTGDTTIVGTTFRSKFADVYTTRQALLNAIYAAAKVLAGNAQSTANNAAAAASAAQSDADTALAELDDIAADGKLTADEKVRAKQDYLTVTGEQAGIDGQATAFGITTEKTAYDNAITALKTYLRTTVDVLDASYNWTGITGTTAITRSTWDSKWTSVYTTRQALLNKIAANAKALADAAQAGADGANGALTVLNPGFEMGNVGWVCSGGFNIESGSPITPVSGTWFLTKYQGSSVQAIAYNTKKVPANPGDVFKVACYAYCRYSDGTALLGIRCYNAAGSAFASQTGPQRIGNESDNGFNQLTGSVVVPAGTAFVAITVIVNGNTTGAWHFEDFDLVRALSTVDELPDGTTYGRPLKDRLSAGRPFIDFAEGIHPNKNLGYLPDGGGRYGVHQVDGNGLAIVDFSQGGHVNKTADYIAESAARKWAAESGATVGADWSGNLKNRPLSQDNLITKSDVDDGRLGMWDRAGVSVGTGTNYFGQTRNWIRLTGTNAIALDSFAVTPGDVLYVSAAMYTGGGTGAGFKLRFADATGATLDYLGPSDATSHGWQIVGGYVTVPAGAVRAAPTLFCTTGYIGYLDLKCVKALDSVPDGLTYGKPLQTRLSNGKPLIDFAEGIHNNKNIDYIGDGSVYGRIATPYLNAARPVINFADSFHPNKTADYIAESAARKWAAESGADVTAKYARVTIANPGFENGSKGWGTDISGSNGALIPGAYITTTYSYGGSAACYRHDGQASPPSNIYQYNESAFAVRPGQRLRIGAATSSVGTPPDGDVRLAVRYYDASGAALSFQFVASDSGTHAWRVMSQIMTVPASAALARVAVGFGSHSTGGYLVDDVFVDELMTDQDELPDGSTYARIKGSELSSGIHRLGIAGSGAVLGNQLNAPNSLTLNYGASRTATALTATSAGAVSVNAFTFRMGGASVAYNAVSNAITGLTVGTTYQIYCRDPGGTGGTKTWYAVAGTQTDALSIADDVVVAGQVTIPGSGSSGGGGSGGSCPVVTARVIRRTATGREFVRAGDVAEGDHLMLASGEWGRVSHSRAVLQPCVRVEDADGLSLSCSRTAPLGRPDGTHVLAPQAAGELVETRTGLAKSASRIAAVYDIGEQWVQHITCENDFFWAGDQPGRLFSHHNLKP